MPKSRKRKRTKKNPASGGGQVKWGGATSTKVSVQGRTIFITIAAVVVAGVGWWLWQTASASREFSTLAEQGQAALAKVVSSRDLGRDHLRIGESYNYRSTFPVSGPHDPTPTRPGFYDAAQPATRLVHAMEHGSVVVYYGTPGNEDMALLKDWAGLYQGIWDGLVVVPRRSLGKRLVLTAWRKRLNLPAFDAAAAAAFIDAFRGRGPENRVR